VGFFLNPSLVDRAADHLRAERAKGRKRLPNLGSLVLLLNATHAAAVRGVVRVSQTYLAARCGGATVRAVRLWEQELVLAGLLRRLPADGSRRLLALVEAPGSSPQVIHNCASVAVCEADTGTTVPVRPEPPFRSRAPTPCTPNKDRARVREEPDSRMAVVGRSPGAELERSFGLLAREVRAGPVELAALWDASSDLARALGPAGAARALQELMPWVLREAASNPASLALHAVRARARHASGRRARQPSLFD
jgi:hypothetical protein